MKDSIALLLIGGIIVSVSIVLLLMHYVIPGLVLFAMASILLISGFSLVKLHEGQPINRRSHME
ncbi:hypothetical protein [Lysinibacillus odysseyi]|uniref:Uncharacterized protein n=1 Tax=Lysinibacillus odysseyi 34hs-1 = NBRC 100172 TaxID=1220589 RepID=A0A0A3IDK0_9BACI|nr:hypothetical protein [Lysinibacillus odysseyi]KGR81565.1 hypothetical protein CD32_19620 [Lysinibacillus odysseyi 34hs-1 = NBRC 100172]